MDFSIIQSPDNLSFSGHLKPYIIQAATEVTFALRLDDNVLFSASYFPDQQSRVTISLLQIVHEALAVQILEDDVFLQSKLLGSFSATFTVDDTEHTHTFRCLRGGLLHNMDLLLFLQTNFLTWQPTSVPVRYSSPNYLSAYMQTGDTVVLEATYDDDTTASYTFATPTTADQVYTYNLRYDNVVRLLNKGAKYPLFFEVYKRNLAQQRLTYRQRFYFQNPLSPTDTTFLFANSLGGLDTLFCTGEVSYQGTSDRTICQLSDSLSQYALSTTKAYHVSTVPLTKEAQRWIQDFFPASDIWLLSQRGLKPIVVTEFDASFALGYTPQQISFSFRPSEVSNYLYHERTAPTDTLSMDTPFHENFQCPSRLCELPFVSLGEGVLIPAVAPFSEQWQSFTVRQLTDYLISRVSLKLEQGHTHLNIDLLNLLQFFIQDNGNTPQFSDFAILSAKFIENHYLSKAHADTMPHHVTFLSGITAFSSNQSPTSADNGINEQADGEVNELPPPNFTVGTLANVYTSADTPAPGALLFAGNDGHYRAATPQPNESPQMADLLVPCYNVRLQIFEYIPATTFSQVMAAPNNCFPYTLPFKLA